jgi:hypothetical protein
MTEEVNISEQIRLLIKRKVKRPYLVYHYSNESALLSIIQNNSLWLTDRKYMNDRQDSTYIENKFLNKFSEKMKHTNLTKPIVPQYIFSTSIIEDSFLHYNCYGNYSIEFDTIELEKYINKCIEAFDTAGRLENPFFSSAVIYDEKMVNNIVKIVVKEYTNSLEKAVNTPYAWEDGLFDQFGNWRTIFMHFFAIIKQNGFVCEHEYRFLIETNAENIKRYRVSGSEIIPYIELKFKNLPKIPIKSIRIGPNANTQIDKEYLDKLLASNGYENIDVKETELKIK